MKLWLDARLSPVWTLLALLGIPIAPASVAGQDTIVVLADAPPAWGDGVGLVEELRIGTLSGSAEYAFGRVVGLVELADGSVVVADEQGPALRRYSGTGEFLGDVGRKGQGPGEYQQILGIARHPAGGLAIWDPSNHRVSRFDDSGAFVESARVASGLFSANVFQVDTAGNYYVRALATGALATLRVGRDAETVWLKVSPMGEILDSLPFPSPMTRGSRFVQRTPSGLQAPFTAVTISAMSPHGYMVSGRNTTYAYTRPLADGRTLRVERSFRPLPLGSQERDQWQAIADRIGRSSLASGVDIGHIPTRKPPYKALDVDAEGRIWVWRYVRAVRYPSTEADSSEGTLTPLDWREPPTWDVYDSRGTLLSTLVAPREGMFAFAAGDVVWMVEQGELGENYVVRYRIRATK